MIVNLLMKGEPVMSEREQNPHVLKQPNIGPQQELSPEAAYLAAVTSLPRILSDVGKVLTGILERLETIDSSLDTIALYHERKGVDEKLLGPDDFPKDEGEDDEPGGE